MKGDAGASAPRSNNFDLIRLAAALLVLWSHSYPISGHPEQEIFFAIFSSYDSGGGIAVSTFFVISGYLVTKSALERPVLDYLIARTLRILPGLVFVVLATVFVIGPMLTRLSIADYAADPTTRDYLWTASVFNIKYSLADTTAGLPTASINGSLWTLPVECGFYIWILFLVKLGASYERLCLGALLLVVGLYFYFTRIGGLDWDHQGSQIWSGASSYAALTNGSFFLMGSAFWIFRAKIPLKFGWALLSVVIWFAAARTPISQLVYFVCLPYLVMILGLRVPARLNLAKTVGDLSYGVYLFAFPIQQAIVHFFGPQITATRLSLLATPATLAIAYVSWRAVEKRALKYKAPANTRILPAAS